MYTFTAKTCSGVYAKTEIERDQVFEFWADCANAMLTGEVVPIKIPSMPTDDHIIQASVIWESPILIGGKTQQTVLATLYWTCDHVAEIVKDERISA
jgi:hypothetical protein